MSDLSYVASGLLANRPNPDPLLTGRLYFATDTSQMFQDTGTDWLTLVDANASAQAASLRTLGTAMTEAAAGNHTHQVDVQYGSWVKNYGPDDGGQTYRDIAVGSVGGVTTNAGMQISITPAAPPSEFLAIATFRFEALAAPSSYVRIRLYHSDNRLLYESDDYFIQYGAPKFITHYFGPSPWPVDGAALFRARPYHVSGGGLLRVTVVNFTVIELKHALQAPADW